MLKKTIFKLGLTYDQIRDKDLALTEHFRVTGTPTVIVLNAAGEVVWREHEAPKSWEAFLE